MKNILRSLGLAVIALGLIFIPKPAPETVSKAECDDIGNPAYAYCTDIMGYEYETITQDDGSQGGVCKMPDGEVCAQWDFYAGKCGAEYSYCALEGMEIETREGGEDPLARVYAVCKEQDGRSAGLVSTLSGLNALSGGDKWESFEEELIEQAPDLESYVRDGYPASFDWRNYNGLDWITPVKNQSGCGSCWAFATLGVVEAFFNISANDPAVDENLAEQYLVSDCCTACGDCGGGHHGNALEYVRASGVTDEVCYPYIAANSLCSARCPDWASRLYFVPNKQYQYLIDANYIKNAMTNNGPVAVSMGYGAGGDPDYGGYWDGDIYRCTNDYGDGGETGTNHALLAVGYDDAGGYWIIKNSWGATWNGDGYFKVGYNECNIDYKRASWVITDLPGSFQTFLPMILNGNMILTDPILNGNFENGQDGSWTEYSSHGWDLIGTTPVTAHSGSWLVWLGGGNSETSQLSQSVLVKPGLSMLHYWYWISSGESVCNLDYFRIKVNTSTQLATGLCSASNTSGWAEGTLDLSAYEGSTVTLMFEVTTTAATSSTTYLDDIWFSAP